jgi:ABC-type nitrate/sulfonate/bicarbonate transport system substrate-binding protein
MPLRIISIPTDPSRTSRCCRRPRSTRCRKLAGKKVAPPPGPRCTTSSRARWRSTAMAMKDVELVNLPAADAQAAFVAGRVDAIVPSVNGRFYITSTKKDTRELFTTTTSRRARPDYAVRQLRRVRHQRRARCSRAVRR